MIYVDSFLVVFLLVLVLPIGGASKGQRTGAATRAHRVCPLCVDVSPLSLCYPASAEAHQRLATKTWCLTVW